MCISNSVMLSYVSVSSFLCQNNCCFSTGTPNFSAAAAFTSAMVWSYLILKYKHGVGSQLHGMSKCSRICISFHWFRHIIRDAFILYNRTCPGEAPAYSSLSSTRANTEQDAEMQHAAPNCLVVAAFSPLTNHGIMLHHCLLMNHSRQT